MDYRDNRINLARHQQKWATFTPP